MPQFQETGYGRKFFEDDLPRLVRAIERIAALLEAANNTDKLNANKLHRRSEDSDKYRSS